MILTPQLFKHFNEVSSQPPFERVLKFFFIYGRPGLGLDTILEMGPDKCRIKLSDNCSILVLVVSMYILHQLNGFNR